MPRYLIIAEATSTCGWYIEAESLAAAVKKAESEGPEWSDLKLDQSEGFEILEVTKEGREHGHQG